MIASSNPRRVSESLLKQFQIDHLIGKVVGPDDVENGKPAPDMLLLALKHYNMSPQNSIMVGDTSHDILAGKNADTKTALILRREHQESVKVTNPDQKSRPRSAMRPSLGGDGGGGLDAGCFD